MPFALLIGLAWAVFIIYWIVSAFNTKRYVRRSYALWWVRAIFVVVVILALQIPGFKAFSFSIAQMSVNPVLGTLGVLFAVLGIGFAVWARVHLGRNWGMPMTLKENPELITTGPYAYVRHPIYTGILLAILGSGLVSLFWLVIFVFAGAYFIYSARTEEKIMLNEFPDQYPAYMKRTKMLIPFVF